ncbi:MAG TPA: helix-turn-helix domain-containing protein [Chromatiaceae bacterium]|nr:helix-turn-helix domain-containing protein [Chromatiaceae bacterium]
METLDLIGAAHFLRMHPETLRRRACRREIPGARAGRAWVFLDLDLAEWLRAQYDHPARAATPQLGDAPRCSTAALTVVNGGRASPPLTARKYEEALGLKTKKPPRNTKPD